jgi:CubicO group peptidase (beta-lactamase class C family)
MVLAKGYGVWQLGGPTPVAVSTLFQIASNTMRFCANVTPTTRPTRIR